MGELILCSRMLAALPYYVEEASLNVYSLEELSYYIVHNVYLLEESFMGEELCSWIGRELKLKEVEQKLREICGRGGTLSEFVTCVLKASGYCDPDTIRKTAEALAETENKSEYECRKIKADRYVEQGHYRSAIREYRRLLGISGEKNEILIGNVWHNLGKAYAGLFLFSEAADCLKRAYAQNRNPESLRECLYAYRCMQDETRCKAAAVENGLNGDEIREIGNTLTQVSRMDEICAFETRLDELFEHQREQEICDIVEEWKDTYRKNCRI